MNDLFAIYYGLGLVWMLLGMLPTQLLGPLTGWLKHDMPWPVALLFAAVCAAIWPLVLAKLAWDVFHGRDFSDL